MKKNLSLLALAVFAFTAEAQITLDHKYTNVSSNALNLDKFQVSGYKYTEINLTYSVINIYNLNHTLFKAIPIPNVPGNKSIYYISENLFDTDNLVEFVLASTITSTVTTFPSTGIVTNFYIFKENGTQLFYRDSASFASGSINNSTNISDNIFFDGSNTKMKISIQQSIYPGGFSSTEIYTLPGTMPCLQCSSGGTTTALSKNSISEAESAVFYPNPVSDQLKLKYTLPKDAKLAIIKITDIQGKLIEEFKVTDSFDYIYLPSNYNNGMYIYSLILDGKAIKTEKIILNK